MGCALTQNLGQPCRQSVGGIKSIFVTEYANIASLVVSGSTVSGFTLAHGTQFFQYQMRKETGDFTEEDTISDVNFTVYYAPTVTFQLPKLQANTTTELALLAQNDLIVIVQDNNNDYLLVGSDKGLQMTKGSAASGTKFGDLNGYKITIANGGESYPHLFVPASLMPILTSPAA